LALFCAGVSSGAAGAAAGAGATVPDCLGAAGAFFLACLASTLSGGSGPAGVVCASAMLAGLVAARNAAVTRPVVDASFLGLLAVAGRLATGRRSEPGMRAELIYSPIRTRGVRPIVRDAHRSAGGKPGYDEAALHYVFLTNKVKIIQGASARGDGDCRTRASPGRVPRNGSRVCATGDLRPGRPCRCAIRAGIGLAQMHGCSERRQQRCGRPPLPGRRDETVPARVAGRTAGLPTIAGTGNPSA
jgi:hypothetical protein